MAASMTAAPLDHRQVRGKGAGITSADLACEQRHAVLYDALEAHGSSLERPAMRASVEKERFDQQPHSGNGLKQTLEIAACRAVGSIFQLLLDRPCERLGDPEPRTTSPANAPKARAPRKPSDASSATSHGASGTSSRRPTPIREHRHHHHLLDIGAAEAAASPNPLTDARCSQVDQPCREPGHVFDRALDGHRHRTTFRVPGAGLSVRPLAGTPRARHRAL